MKGASRDASAPPVALWATLLFLFVTNGVTLFALTTLNMRYHHMQTTPPPATPHPCQLHPPAQALAKDILLYPCMYLVQNMYVHIYVPF